MWIKCEDKMPEVGQKLWYYFDVVGSHRGTFDGYYVDDDGYLVLRVSEKYTYPENISSPGY